METKNTTATKMRKEPKFAGPFDFVVFRGVRESTVTACSVFLTCFYIIVYTYCMKKKNSSFQNYLIIGDFRYMCSTLQNKI
jgi:hypothetical protein